MEVMGVKPVVGCSSNYSGSTWKVFGYPKASLVQHHPLSALAILAPHHALFPSLPSISTPLKDYVNTITST